MKETFEFDNLMDAIGRAHSQLPNMVAATIINFTQQRFREEAWADTYQKPWPRRKELRGRKRSRRRQRGLLVKTGRLKRSIRKISANPEQVVIGTDVEYAQFHNQGSKGTVTVNEHTRHRYTKVKERYTTRTGRERTRTTRQVDSGSEPIKVKSHRRRVNNKARQFIGVSALLNTQLERLVTGEYMKVLKQHQ
jgi:phage gpG-like protein